MKHYVGIKKDGWSYKRFTANEMPTATTHGQDYAAVIGPFRTRRGAQYMANYGRGNPHLQHVIDAERLAKS